MEEQYDKIEKYLDGELSGEELQRFEKRLQEDPEFAQEVALHRRLHQVLGNAGEWQLRQNLEAIGASIQESDMPPPDDDPPPAKGNGWFIPGLLLFILAGSVFAWLLLRPAAPDPLAENETTPPAPTERTDQVIPQDDPSDAQPESTPDAGTNESAPEPAPEPAPAPDPYQPNPALEALLDPERHSNVHDFDLTADLRPDSLVFLTIEGELLSAALPEQPFILEGFDRRPASYAAQPFLRVPLEPIAVEEDRPFAFAAKKAYLISFDTLIDLERGLYYYQVRLENDPAPLFVGKFRN